MIPAARALSARRAAACLSVLLAGSGSGCSSPPHAASRPTAAQPAPEPLHEGSLADYVPAAGLRWMVVGRPRQLAKNGAFAEALSPLFPAERLDAYAAATGIDLRRTPSALIAGFDYGTLYLAETTNENRRVEQLFSQRLTRDPITKRPHPRLHRMLGVVGDTPQALVSIRGHLIAVAVGDTTLTRVVEAFARRQLRDSPPALEGASLSTLPVDLERAPVRFYAPGPFEGEWLAGARGLLAATTALGLAAHPRKRERLEVVVVLAGDWTGAGADPASRLADAWNDLAQSSTGRLLGFHRPAAAPVVSAAADQLRLEVELEIPLIVAGLRAAVSADVWEILEVPASEGRLK